MSEESSFVRFYVLLAGEWATQCSKCWRVIAYSRDENALAAAEAAHECLAKKPGARAAAESCEKVIP